MRSNDLGTKRARDRAAWRRARSFDELCALGARFVAGELAWFPGWGAAELDVESDAIRASLVALNRAGWLTTCSQPARVDVERGLEQRAFACGFASERVARMLVGLAARDRSIRVRVERRGERVAGPVTVTREPARGRAAKVARVAIGGPAIEAELMCFADDLAPAMLAELARRPYVSAWDVAWGREERLWPALEQALAPRRR